MSKEKEIQEMAEVINCMDERNAHYYDKHMQECEAFADAENIAKALYNAGYRKEIDVAEEIFAELDRVSPIMPYNAYIALKNKYRKGKEDVN